MSWLDIGAVLAGVVVVGSLIGLLDPELIRGWLARLGGHGPGRP